MDMYSHKMYEQTKILHIQWGKAINFGTNRLIDRFFCIQSNAQEYGISLPSYLKNPVLILGEVLYMFKKI
jgi:hypothetical protein